MVWLKNFYIKNKFPLKIGGVAVLICILLGIFYINLFSKNSEYSPITAIAPMVTGHGELFAISFMIGEGGDNVPFSHQLCGKETVCTSWTAPVGCENWIVYPDQKCAGIIGSFISLILTILFILLYFVIGFFIGKIIERQKNKK